MMLMISSNIVVLFGPGNLLYLECTFYGPSALLMRHAFVSLWPGFMVLAPTNLSYTEMDHDPCDCYTNIHFLRVPGCWRGNRK